MILGLGNTIPSDSVRQGLGGGGGGGFTNTYSLAFDGVDDFIGFSPFSLSAEFTLSAWVKPVSLSANQGNIISSATSNANKIGISSASSVQVKLGGILSTITDGGGNNFSIGVWQHILIIRDSSNIVTVFRNGSAFGSPSSANAGTGTYDSIGKFNNSQFLDEQLDEVAYWTSDQSSNIGSIYSASGAVDLTSLNPTAWYRMGDNGSYKSPQWLIPNNSNKDKVSNYSFSFDGVDDYIDVGELLQLSNATALTVSLWFNAASSGTNNKILLDFKEGTSRVVVQRIGSQIYLYVNNKHAIYNIATSLDTWYHLAYVFDGTGATDADRLKLYINGAEISASSFSGTIPTSIGAFTPGFMKCKIGSLYNNASPSTYNWVGKLDEIAVFLSAKSSSDITAIYNSGTPTTITGALAHWKMGEEANFTDNWLVNNSALSNYSTRSFAFDGVDDYIQLSSPMSTSGTDWSISCWFKSSQSGGNKIFVGYTGSYYFGINWSKLTFISSDNSFDMTSTSNMNDGNWHNIIYTYNYTTGAWKSYIDGVIDDNQTATTSVNIPPWNFFGARSSTQYFAECNLDEISYFETELSASDVTAIYNSGQPTDLTSYSPKGWWRMGEDATFSTNWSLPDNGSASNTGTSANMTIADLEGDAPNYTGGGLSNNMTIEDRVGEAPNSTSNALSYNMTESDRVEDTPPS
jgi:hypothetical protein